MCKKKKKKKKKVNDFFPPCNFGFSLLMLSNVVMDNVRRGRMTEKVFDRLSRRKDKFVANLSHEVCSFFVGCCFFTQFSEQIRTPLHGLLGSAEMLKSDRSLSTKAQENVDAILHCSSALRLLIENVLAVGFVGKLVKTRVNYC
jgi:signal transduction histidine kinase